MRLAGAHTAMCAQVLAGSVVAQGEAEALVTATGGSTFFGKTVALLSEPEEVGHLRKVWLSSPMLPCALGICGGMCVPVHPALCGCLS